MPKHILGPKLIGLDYMGKTYAELKDHPDFSPHALRVIYAISQMTTKEIENLDLLKGK